MSSVSPRNALLIAGLGLGTLGILTASIGPALPNLASNTASDLATIGSIFSALFLGGLLTQLFGGPLDDRFGQRPVMLTGVALMALGCIGIATSHVLVLTLACALIAGMGRGALSISSHLLIARAFTSRSAAALNILNVFYGIGAVVGPLIAGAALRSWNTALPILWVGAALLLLQVPLILMLGNTRRAAAQHATPHPPADPILRQPIIWLFGVLVLLYVGGETGFGGWMLTYLERTLAIDAASAAVMSGWFWLAITAGRVIAALIGTRLPGSYVLLGSIIIGFIGSVLVVAGAGNATLSMVAIVVLGVGFGPVYPTAIALVTTFFRRAPGSAASLTSALGGLGGVALPWIQGNILEYRGPVASMVLLIGTSLGMLVLFGLIHVVTTRIAAKPTPTTT